MKTSGLLFHVEKDGSFVIGYEDYNVDFYDGDDVEVTYRLDPCAFKKLLCCLQVEDETMLKDKLIKAFASYFHAPKFKKFCEQYEIIYQNNIHIS